MITSDLQKRILNGEREAFRSVYEQYGRNVYFSALEALGSEEDARALVKKVFLLLHSELMRACDDVDIHQRIRELTDNELLLLQVLGSKSGEQAAAAVSAHTRAEEAGEPLEDPDLTGYTDADGNLPRVELPPLERTRTYMRADDPSAEKRGKAGPHGRRHGFLTFLLVLLLLVLLWVLAGVLMGLGYLPKLGLGYGWFNTNVFPFFSIGA